MLVVTLDPSVFDLYLQRPDLFLIKLLYWVGWIPIAAVMVWGFFEMWIFYRQEGYRHKQKYLMLAIDVPRETEQSPKAMEHFFAAVSALWSGANFREKWIDGEVSPVISFELVSDGGYIQYYIRTVKKYRSIIEAALYSAYPDAEISECDDYTKSWPDKFPNDEIGGWGAENRLGKADYFPIRTYEMFEHKMSQELKDPLGLMLEQFGQVRPGEILATQFLLEPLGPEQNKWHKPGIAYIYKEIGKEEKGAHKTSILAGLTSAASSVPGELLSELGLWGAPGEHGDEKEEDPWKFLRSTPLDKARLDLVTQKIGKPAMHVKIRHVFLAPTATFTHKIVDKMLKAVYAQYKHMDSNYFIRTRRVQPIEDYAWQKYTTKGRAQRVVRAFKRRDAEVGGHHFILNVEELATLWHFPSILVRAPFVNKTLAKRAEPPVQLPTEIEGVIDFVQEAAEFKEHVVAVPVEFTEPTMPHRPIAPPRSAMPAPIEKTEDRAEFEPQMVLPPVVIPTMPEPQRTKPPATTALPDAVRALFDPSVEFKADSFEKTEEEKNV